MPTLPLNLNKKMLQKVLVALGLIRAMPESDLETLEILSNKKNVKFFERSLAESKANKISPIETIN